MKGGREMLGWETPGCPGCQKLPISGSFVKSLAHITYHDFVPLPRAPRPQTSSGPRALWERDYLRPSQRMDCACSSCKCLAFPEFEGPGHQTAAEAEPWDPNPNYFIWLHTEIKNKKQTLINFVIIEWNHFMSVASNIYMDLNFKSF